MNSTQFLALGNPVFSADSKPAPVPNGGDLHSIWARLLQGDARTALAKVSGDFAVGWRDAQGRTVLAVDRFAEHSLCWTLRDGELLFADRADALSTDTSQLDPQALFDYLYFHAIPS